MKKTFIIIAAVLLIVAAVYFYVMPGKNILETMGVKKPVAPPAAPATKDDLTNKTPTSGGFVDKAKIVRDSNGFPLVEGESGGYLRPDQSVKDIQKALNDRFGSSLAVDGIFGPKTAKALNVHGYPEIIYLDDFYEILGI
jgi:hypothetical protein